MNVTPSVWGCGAGMRGPLSPTLVRPHPLGGEQALWRFPNGYGASVVKHPLSIGSAYGYAELAVLRFHGPEVTDFELDYSTPVTADVLGSLDPEAQREVLSRIRDMPGGTA